MYVKQAINKNVMDHSGFCDFWSICQLLTFNILLRFIPSVVMSKPSLLCLHSLAIAVTLLCIIPPQHSVAYSHNFLSLSADQLRPCVCESGLAGGSIPGFLSFTWDQCANQGNVFLVVTARYNVTRPSLSNGKLLLPPLYRVAAGWLL